MFDTTQFVRESITAVVHTLIEAMLLVVLVVAGFVYFHVGVAADEFDKETFVVGRQVLDDDKGDIGGVGHAVEEFVDRFEA